MLIWRDTLLHSISRGDSKLSTRWSLSWNIPGYWTWVKWLTPRHSSVEHQSWHLCVPFLQKLNMLNSFRYIKKDKLFLDSIKISTFLKEQSMWNIAGNDKHILGLMHSELVTPFATTVKDGRIQVTAAEKCVINNIHSSYLCARLLQHFCKQYPGCSEPTQWPRETSQNLPPQRAAFLHKFSKYCAVSRSSLQSTEFQRVSVVPQHH